MSGLASRGLGGIRSKDNSASRRVPRDHPLSHSKVFAQGGHLAPHRAVQPFLTSRYNMFIDLVEMVVASNERSSLSVELAWCPGDCAFSSGSGTGTGTGSDTDTDSDTDTGTVTGRGTGTGTTACPSTTARPAYDRPSGAGADMGPLPALTPVGCLGSDSIAAPMQYNRPGEVPLAMSWAAWPTTQQKLLRAAARARARVGNATHPKIVFRGRAAYCWDGVDGSDGDHGAGAAAKSEDGAGAGSRECGRAALFKLGEARPEMVDYRHTPLEMVATGDGAFNSYRYTIVVEGNCGWADRTRLLLHQAPALLIQESYCKELFAFALQPWVVSRGDAGRDGASGAAPDRHTSPTHSTTCL